MEVFMLAFQELFNFIISHFIPPLVGVFLIHDNYNNKLEKEEKILYYLLIIATNTFFNYIILGLFVDQIVYTFSFTYKYLFLNLFMSIFSTILIYILRENIKIKIELTKRKK